MSRDLFCHACSSLSHDFQLQGDEQPLCPSCQSDFVEFREPVDQTQQNAGQGRPNVADEDPMQILQRMIMNAFASPQGAQVVIQGPGGFGPFNLGNIGDFGFGNMEDIMARLMEQHQPQNHPTSEELRNNLPKRKVPANADHKGDAEYAVGANCKAGDPCSICHTEFAADEVVSQLPCEHCFHDSCIKPWLEVQNTCPICRAELPRSQSSSQAGPGGQQAPTVDVPLNANNFLSGLMPIDMFGGAGPAAGQRNGRQGGNNLDRRPNENQPGSLQPPNTNGRPQNPGAVGAQAQNADPFFQFQDMGRMMQGGLVDQLRQIQNLAGMPLPNLNDHFGHDSLGESTSGDEMDEDEEDDDEDDEEYEDDDEEEEDEDASELEDSLMESGEEEEEDDLPEEEPPSVRPRDYPSIDSVIPDTQTTTPSAEAVNALRESPSESIAVDDQAPNGGTVSGDNSEQRARNPYQIGFARPSRSDRGAMVRSDHTEADNERGQNHGRGGLGLLEPLGWLARNAMNLGGNILGRRH